LIGYSCSHFVTQGSSLVSWKALSLARYSFSTPAKAALRRGMDSRDVVRRFRNERQILASVDHPNIAKLLDGGTTEGEPITTASGSSLG
jgi:serine/threonine protein kinase